MQFEVFIACNTAFKGISSLKVVKIDTECKCYNFRGQMSGGGGQAQVGKWDQVPDRGIDQIFANWGDPSPPRKKKPGKIDEFIPENQFWQILDITGCFPFYGY